MPSLEIAHNTNLYFQMEKISDDSDTDDDNKFPVGPLRSTISEPCDMGGQLFDEDVIMGTTSTAGNNNATSAAAAGNKTTSASNRAGPSQEIGWRADESYK